MGYYYCIGLHCDATKYGGTPWSWAVSSGRALSATNTLRSFKRCGTKGVYRQMSCWGITRHSAVLYRLLTQTIEAPKKRTVKSDKHIKRKSGKGR